MTIETTFSIGDRINVFGEKLEIISLHVYISENRLTERLYLSNGKWVTMISGKKE